MLFLWFMPLFQSIYLGLFFLTQSWRCDKDWCYLLGYIAIAMEKCLKIGNLTFSSLRLVGKCVKLQYYLSTRGETIFICHNNSIQFCSFEQVICSYILNKLSDTLASQLWLVYTQKKTLCIDWRTSMQAATFFKR